MEIQKGQKARIVSNKNEFHGFDINEEVTYAGELYESLYGLVYCFKNEFDDIQWLKPEHFELIVDIAQENNAIDTLKINKQTEFLMDEIMEFHMDSLVNKYLDEKNYKALDKLFNEELAQ